MSLSRTERRFLSLGVAIAIDAATHHASVRYLGVPARTIAARTLGITAGLYYSGMGLSYIIDEDEGVANYRYAVDTILGSPGGFKEIVHDSIFNVSMAIAPGVDDLIDRSIYAGKALFQHSSHFVRTMFDMSVQRHTNDLLM